MAEKINLKPCPFCGGPVEVSMSGTSHFGDRFGAFFKAECPKCDLGFTSRSIYEVDVDSGQCVCIQDGLEEVKKIWNTRYGEKEEDHAEHNHENL